MTPETSGFSIYDVVPCLVVLHGEFGCVEDSIWNFKKLCPL